MKNIIILGAFFYLSTSLAGTTDVIKAESFKLHLFLTCKDHKVVASKTNWIEAAPVESMTPSSLTTKDATVFTVVNDKDVLLHGKKIGELDESLSEKEKTMTEDAWHYCELGPDHYSYVPKVNLDSNFEVYLSAKSIERACSPNKFFVGTKSAHVKNELMIQDLSQGGQIFKGNATAYNYDAGNCTTLKTIGYGFMSILLFPLAIFRGC